MNNNHSSAPIPVGFRFHPTDEELVGYYLHGKVGRAQRDQLIQELDLYKIEPWDLHEVCRIGDDAAEAQSDWYFFSHKDKKYPTGNRANRATAAGFWKATGRDKPIHMAQQQQQQQQQHRHVIGMRKTLVFYKGRAPHGQKTDWIMHEFRLDEGPGVVPNYESDGWVVCRVFRKTKNFKTKSQDDTSCSFEEDGQQPHLLPELLSPPSAGAMKLVFNGDHLTCKQEISVDDYTGGTPLIHDVTSSSFLHDHHSLALHLPVGDHMRVSLPVSTLAPCSSSTFRDFCNRSSRPGEYSVAPFDDAHEDQSPFWMPMENHKSIGTRRDQTLADITSHVGRMKRQAMDHHESNLVHLWNVL